MLSKVEILQTIRKYLNEWKEEIIRNHERAGQVASGKTKDSIQVKMREDGGSLVGASYIYVLEKGRGKSKKSQGGVLKNNIKSWILAKGITPDGKVKLDDLAYLITRKIHEEGTQLFKNGGRTDIYSNVITRENIKKMIKEIGVDYMKQIKSQIVNV